MTTSQGWPTENGLNHGNAAGVQAYFPPPPSHISKTQTTHSSTFHLHQNPTKPITPTSKQTPKASVVHS